jgi:hypothetical protein
MLWKIDLRSMYVDVFKEVNERSQVHILGFRTSFYLTITGEKNLKTSSLWRICLHNSKIRRICSHAYFRYFRLVHCATVLMNVFTVSRRTQTCFYTFNIISQNEIIAYRFYFTHMFFTLLSMKQCMYVGVRFHMYGHSRYGNANSYW